LRDNDGKPVSTPQLLERRGHYMEIVKPEAEGLREGLADDLEGSCLFCEGGIASLWRISL